MQDSANVHEWLPSDAALNRIIDAVGSTPQGKRLVDRIKRGALAGALMLAWSDSFVRFNLVVWSREVKRMQHVAKFAIPLRHGLRDDAAQKLFRAGADKLEWLDSVARLADHGVIRLRQAEIITEILGLVYREHIGKIGISNAEKSNPFVRFVLAVAREWQISPPPKPAAIVWALRAAKKKGA